MANGFHFLIQLFGPCVSQRHLHADVKTFKDEKVGNESWRCVWVKYQIKKPGYIYEPAFQWWNLSPLGPLRFCSPSASQLLLRCQVKLLTSQILNESFKYVRSYVLRNLSIRYLNTRFFSSRIISQAGVNGAQRMSSMHRLFLVPCSSRRSTLLRRGATGATLGDNLSGHWGEGCEGGSSMLSCGFAACGRFWFRTYAPLTRSESYIRKTWEWEKHFLCLEYILGSYYENFLVLKH